MSTPPPVANNTHNSKEHKRKRGNVITITNDYDIRNDRYTVQLHSPFQIDQEDCKIVDAIIQCQRENAKDPIQSRQISNVDYDFMTRRTMVEIDHNYRVSSLSLSKAICDTLPDCILGFDALQTLSLAGAHNLQTIPSWIGKLHNLTELYLPTHASFSSLPENIWNLTKLQVFAYANWSACPESSSLTIDLPPAIGNLQHLRELRVAQVGHLPHEIGNARSLELLELPAFKGTLLPASIGNLTHLRALCILRAPNLTSLPESIANCNDLQNLSIQDSGLQSLPPSIGNLQSLRCLNLERNRFLKGLPESIGRLTTLSALSLDASAIRSLPNSVGNLCNLTYLNLKSTPLQQLPDEIGNLTNLIWLELAHSRISSLPDTKYLKPMKHLKFLKLGNTVLASKTSSQDILRDIALQLPAVGCFGDIDSRDKDLAILRALSFNRATNRIFHPLNQPDQIWIPRVSLWPSILANVSSASAVYPHCDSRFRYCRCSDTTCSNGSADTVFRLLVDYGSLFLSPETT